MLAARHRARLAMADTNPDSQEQARLKSVRRRLNFGPDDDNGDDDGGGGGDSANSKTELERKFEEERAKELEQKKAKWNFDFETGRPLEGRWEWSLLQGSNATESSESPARPVAPVTTTTTTTTTTMPVPATPSSSPPVGPVEASCAVAPLVEAP